MKLIKFLKLCAFVPLCLCAFISPSFAWKFPGSGTTTTAGSTTTTAGGGSVDLSAPGPIGATTPAPGTFTYITATYLNGISGNASTGYTFPAQISVSPSDGTAAGVAFAVANDIPPIAKGNSNYVFAWNRNVADAGSPILYKRTSGTITLLTSATTVATTPTGYNFWFGDTIYTIGAFDYGAAGFTEAASGTGYDITATIAMDGSAKVLKIVTSDTLNSLYITAPFAAHTDAKQFRVSVWMRTDSAVAAEAPQLQLISPTQPATSTDYVSVGKTASDATYYSARRKSNAGTASGGVTTIAVDTGWHFFEIVTLSSTTAAAYVDGVKVNTTDIVIDPFRVEGADATGWSTKPYILLNFPGANTAYYIKSLMVTQEEAY